MPPRRRQPSMGPRPKAGDLILYRTSTTADILIIWSIQSLPQDTIQVLSWNRIRSQHINRIRTLVSSDASAEICIRAFVNRIVRPLLRNPQASDLRQVQILGDVLANGGEVFFQPWAESVRKVLNGDRCNVPFCGDGYVDCTVAEFLRRWPMFERGMGVRTREWLRGGRRVLCPQCQGFEEVRLYIRNVVEGGRERMERVRALNEVRRELGYTTIDESDVPGRQVGAARSSSGLGTQGGRDVDVDEGEWEVWPEAMSPFPTTSAAASSSNINAPSNDGWQHWPAATHPTTQQHHQQNPTASSSSNPNPTPTASSSNTSSNHFWQQWAQTTQPPTASPSNSAALDGFEHWPEALNPPTRHSGWEYFPEALDPNSTPTFTPANTTTIASLIRGRATKNQADEPENECHICIEGYVEGQQTMYLPCGHYFHEDCVVPWLKTSAKCPVCSLGVGEGGK